MAKKPDFTQKLLVDLRMRKEHMAKSHNSNRSGQLVTERYRDFKRPYGESREPIGSTTRDMQKWSGRSNRSLDMGESSRQLVPVGRTRSSEQIGDLSMALAFAFQNGRDFRTRNSGDIMASYMNHLEKTRRSSGQFPTLSHLHITEISRGAQKLNQILKACYNGLNFDIYSVDIGTELLKGALDLEESLKMLISLQEASEYMVSPRRKQQKVRLLEMDDNGEESNVEAKKQTQIGPPRFSFDKPSKKSTVKQKPLALPYHTETPYLGSEKQTPSTSKLISHRRSVSCGAESSKSTSLSIIRKQSTSTESQSERGRIPNVIAKLMGLEELPPNKESNVPPHKEPHVKQEARARKESERNLQKKPAQRIATQKLAQTEKQYTVPNSTSLVVYVPPETLVPEGKVHLERKKTEGARLMSNSIKSDVKINKPEINMAQWHPTKESLMEKLEKKRKQENLTPRKQMKKGREEGNEAVLKDSVKTVAPGLPKKWETANGKKEWTRTEKETRFANKKAINHVQTRSNDWKSSQKKPLLINQELSSKKKSTEALDRVSPKRSGECRNKEDIAREKNLKLNKAPNHSLAEQAPSTRDSKADAQNLVVPVVARKYVHAPLAEKENNIEVHDGMTPKGTKEGVTRENDFASELLKEQSSTAEVPKHSPKSKVRTSKEADLRLHRSNEAEAQTQLSTPIAEVYPRLNDFEPSSNARIQDSTTTVSDSLYPSAVSPHEHQIQDKGRNVSETLVPSKVSPTEEVLTSSDSKSTPNKGYHEARLFGVSKPFQREQHKRLQHYTPQQLTEEEKHLKQTLVNSQLFLNAAEALFGLLIPVEMLQYSNKKDSDNDNKLALDCAYEVMKRKGRRREFMFHPWANIYTGTLRIKCLDDLVKDLHEDLKTICTEHESDEQDDAANRQQEMIQKDLQNNKPDVNCMWDLEWGAAIFAYTEKQEVAKDIEKHVLNRLLDEFTLDMLQLTIVAR